MLVSWFLRLHQSHCFPAVQFCLPPHSSVHPPFQSSLLILPSTCTLQHAGMHKNNHELVVCTAAEAHRHEFTLGSIVSRRECGGLSGRVPITADIFNVSSKRKRKKKEKKKKCRGNSSAPYRGEGFRGDHHAVKTTR